jgi:hypothetical protein
MGTGSFFPGVKLPDGDNHSPQISAEVKEKVHLYIYSPSGPSMARYRVNFTFVFTIQILILGTGWLLKM